MWLVRKAVADSDGISTDVSSSSCSRSENLPAFMACSGNRACRYFLADFSQINVTRMTQPGEPEEALRQNKLRPNFMCLDKFVLN
jgi:hypothetical protein